MANDQKLRAHWRCRRGMKELDLLLLPFVDKKYDLLTKTQKDIFLTLLDNDDFILFQWFIIKNMPDDIALRTMITDILEHSCNVEL